MAPGTAAFALLLPYLVGLEAARSGELRPGGGAETDLSTEAILRSGCTDQKICVVSANAPTTHSGGITALMQGCLHADDKTQVIALAMQDFPGKTEVPQRVANLQGLVNDARFKLRHAMMLSEDTGEGALCYYHFEGTRWATIIAGAFVGLKLGKLGALGFAAGPIAGTVTMTGAAIAGAALTAGAWKAAFVALDANCGGVALVVYSLASDQVHLDMGVNTSNMQGHMRLTGGTTATTKKGSVMAKFVLNGRRLVIASTHGQEGVRGKHQREECSAATLGTEDEHKRVEDFQLALDKIQQLRHGSEDAVGAIWGGDFNSRSVEPDGERMGCPLWPLAGDADPNATHDDEDLGRLERGRGVLGSLPNRSTPVTFQNLLEDSDLREADNLVCPTYKKEEPQSGEHGEGRQFRCHEEGETMFYKASHPPSWVDRIFYSTDQPWLKCGKLKRVTHQNDHDAVLLSCSIAGQCDG